MNPRVDWLYQDQNGYFKKFQHAKIDDNVLCKNYGDFRRPLVVSDKTGVLYELIEYKIEHVKGQFYKLIALDWEETDSRCLIEIMVKTLIRENGGTI